MKTIAIVAFMSMISVSSFTQAEEPAIRNLLHQQVTNWNEGNLEGFMETYWKSDSLLFTGKNGPEYGWHTVLNNYKKRYPDAASMGKLKFDILEIRPLSKDYYFVSGKWDLTRAAGNIGGYYTLLLKKINGQWLIVVDHTS